MGNGLWWQGSQSDTTHSVEGLAKIGCLLSSELTSLGILKILMQSEPRQVITWPASRKILTFPLGLMIALYVAFLFNTISIEEVGRVDLQFHRAHEIVIQVKNEHLVLFNI